MTAQAAAAYVCGGHRPNSNIGGGGGPQRRRRRRRRSGTFNNCLLPTTTTWRDKSGVAVEEVEEKVWS
jgi:hypothetical protein